MIDQSLNLVAGLKIVKKGKTLFVLTTVRRGDIPVPQEFSYAYTPNSSLIATVTSPAHIVSNVYEPDRDVLASKVNKKLDTTTVSSYFYTVNNYGQRTGVTTGGTAFSGTPSWLWGYNNKGEIVKADSSEANFDRSYQYDGIGNRLKAADSLTLPTQNNYTPNALNQYSSITNPQSTILNPSYDADGNMTSGPLPANVNANSTLTWDAENRLIQAQLNGGNTVNYKYDSQSRRIAETVGSATTVYVYDGWNPIAEYSFSSLPAPSSTLMKSYTWGMDLSGSIQGAGGVGGLLAVAIHDQQSSIFYPLFDGNGNVSEYLDSNGNTVAHYEYDPFGKTVVSTGSKASDFSHRFSTKPLDVTTGLYYYGYRYYDPVTGRWPSRDPIEEDGGINLYVFVGNDGVNWWDYLGFLQEAPTKPLTSTTPKAVPKAVPKVAPAPKSLPLRKPIGRPGLGPLSAALMLGEASWYLGIESVHIETSLRQANDIKEISKRLKDTLKDRAEDYKKDKCKRTCTYEMKPRIGGDPWHNKYAERISGSAHEWKVTTPEINGFSLSARYDGGTPNSIMYEAKTRHYFMIVPGHYAIPFATIRMAEQFTRQSVVAKICKFDYKIAVDNEIGYMGIKKHLPMFPIEHIPY